MSVANLLSFPLQTPTKKTLEGHVSTGHADSPVTIVVGRAFNRRVVQPAGAAPTLVHNVALLKKNMKMDEDLTGETSCLNILPSCYCVWLVSCSLGDFIELFAVFGFQESLRSSARQPTRGDDNRPS